MAGRGPKEDSGMCAACAVWNAGDEIGIGFHGSLEAEDQGLGNVAFAHF